MPTLTSDEPNSLAKVMILPSTDTKPVAPERINLNPPVNRLMAVRA
ncbi:MULTISPECIES: hypothetical protein [unclassified Moraxella]